MNNNARKSTDKRRSYHNKQSPGEFYILFRTIMSVMSHIDDRNSVVKPCSDCQIRHADRDQTDKNDEAICNNPMYNIQDFAY
ncbi:hypothetical protein ACROYT_G024665 [Oculina patagonica]